MIPRILPARPSLERYRTRSHNTLEELGLPRRQLRVKSAVSTLCQPLPVYPDQRTSSDRPSWSGWCQKRMSSPNRSLVDAAMSNPRP
jgi:hypothetical protein